MNTSSVNAASYTQATYRHDCQSAIVKTPQL